MRKKPLQWWVIPGIVTGGIAAMSGLGKLAVDYATQAKLPERVEAAEKKNLEQDSQLGELRTIQKQNQELMTRQQSIFELMANQVKPDARPTQTFTEEDNQGRWTCAAADYEECWTRKLWRAVE